MIGESGTGKTCLVKNYQNGTFDEEHLPSVLDLYVGEVTIDETVFAMEIIDTSGDAQLSLDRQLMYKDVDCFILCAAVSNKTMNSPDDVREQLN